MSGQVMYPTFLSQLSHDRIDPRKSRLALSDKFFFVKTQTRKRKERNYGRILTHVCPLGKCLDVLVPRDLHADWIALHPIEIRVLRRGAVKEFAPQKLPVQRERRHRLFYLKKGNIDMD